MKDYSKIIADLSVSKEERIQAAFQLENTQDEPSIIVLSQVLKTEPSPIVRHEIAFSLGESGRPDLVAKPLMDAVESDPNIFVRHEAILALSTLGKKEFIPFVKKFLNDPDQEIAESAEIALQRLES